MPKTHSQLMEEIDALNRNASHRPRPKRFEAAPAARRRPEEFAA